MPVLPQSFLGKKVYLDGGEKRYYVLKYEESRGKRKIHALLFDREAPVIFAVLDHNGTFLDSFYLSNKTTAESAKAMEEYKKISERKKQHKVTQDDLKDALKPEDEAKMKNENILKHLVDEHLEDIKHLWPSRLIALQNADGKSDDSLILTTLKEAIEQANALKAFKFLLKHRMDSFIPLLAKNIQDYPQLTEDVADYYLSYDRARIVEQFLYKAAAYADIEDPDQIEKLLEQAQKIDHVYYSSVFRHTLIRLLKRVKAETDSSTKDWLNKTINNPSLRKDIVQILKNKVVPAK
ncbi:hypothetical protein [Salipaludibacillus aurantiacus]|uniref:Uncharacterized protein n=1 Tax=Salipaludibacillus aurantiacus TaxID=1601833 RepID=A0A1H9SN77_9BACI|nr:hypothetical protein [Salipaludibacillus aurantiacus]SER85823.1 hypothetical protein SAMN05518684_104291 [Salipaludibacillus aurantiacus]